MEAMRAFGEIFTLFDALSSRFPVARARREFGRSGGEEKPLALSPSAGPVGIEDGVEDVIIGGD
ncbi:hypothetical protein [Rhodopirellula sallentina]|uniref:Uncharacterized protein n=1 Tax=Rhodopirellula sallentina SM41 TaxID=1263870 RepID=M5U506_9BACT|nr:hypothetical protein [Rhodopirellula sallentina]EMI56530.1 hypothetical protein RSSM_02003 [Rhodopirellula sallentina SM41]